MHRRKAGFFIGLTETVPGANVLANIAAKHPVVKLVLHITRYQLVFQFNGKIGNTFAAINFFAG